MNKLTYRFLGWWNSCYHWSMAIYVGTGRTRAYIDLANMETDIKTLIKTLVPGLVGAGVLAQLLFAVLMIWYSQGTLIPPSMKEEEPESMYLGLLEQKPPQETPRIPTLDFVDGLQTAENGTGGSARYLDFVAGDQGQVTPLLTSQHSLEGEDPKKG